MTYTSTKTDNQMENWHFWFYKYNRQILIQSKLSRVMVVYWESWQRHKSKRHIKYQDWSISLTQSYTYKTNTARYLKPADETAVNTRLGSILQGCENTFKCSYNRYLGYLSIAAYYFTLKQRLSWEQSHNISNNVYKANPWSCAAF